MLPVFPIFFPVPADEGLGNVHDELAMAVSRHLVV
tara:strand:- start:139 stop:243 length:105 start_codon:yes stop_codon:yes gene_type:complete